MLELTMLPARQGDAIWIRWGNEDAPHQLLIDMGTGESGDYIRRQLEALDENRREFELLVVTHMDGDHIGGVLSCLADAQPLQGLIFKDVWFNGWVHLNGGQVSNESDPALESFGAAQGERLSNWLREQNWNKAFSGKQVSREPSKKPIPIALTDGLSLTVLGPTPERLKELIPRWKEEVEIALEKGTLREVCSKLESYGGKVPPLLETHGDLRALADSCTGRDPSESNGTSISLLLEYKNRRILLTGDAYAADLVAGLAEVSPEKNLFLDAVKVPHHGSRNNITKELVRAITSPRWLVSTDGTQFRHPDPAAIACAICYSDHTPVTLFFNVPSAFSRWWSNPEWQRMFQYNSEYGNRPDGITIRLTTDGPPGPQDF